MAPAPAVPRGTVTRSGDINHGAVVTLQDAFVFDFAAGVDVNGRFRGKAIPTGVRPRFTERFNDRGSVLSPAVFGTPANARSSR